MSDKKKTVSLVLGSGGARGLAHIGVIRWLEEHNYEIKIISGSSMGALVGGIYGAGKLDIFEKWVRALQKRDVIKLLDFSFSFSGLFSGDRIMQTLDELLGDINIEDLPIKFTAVASDLDTETEVWFDKGSLFTAIRASMSIPTVFTPVSHQGRLLVDGAVLNPIPVGPTLTHITDLTIAISLSGKRTHEVIKEISEPVTNIENKYLAGIADFIDSMQKKYRPEKVAESKTTDVFDIMLKSYETMQNTIARFKLAGHNPDYLLEVPTNSCKILEFHRANEMIDFGYKLAAENIQE